LWRSGSRYPNCGNNNCKSTKNSGYNVFSTKEYMSLVRVVKIPQKFRVSSKRVISYV